MKIREPPVKYRHSLSIGKNAPDHPPSASRLENVVAKKAKASALSEPFGPSIVREGSVDFSAPFSLQKEGAKCPISI